MEKRSYKSENHIQGNTKQLQKKVGPEAQPILRSHVHAKKKLSF